MSPQDADEQATVGDRPALRGHVRPGGSKVGRYAIERVIGEGGMGTVYTAMDPDLERRVALKVLRGGEPGDDGSGGRARLLREARAMARLQHPNVVTVHEVGTADDCDYVAMELIEGGSLAEWLSAGKRSQHEIVDAFIAAGRGLAAAHAAGIVHRDFKPHNVLRSASGRVLVTDFGLARGVEQRADPMAQTLPPTGVPVTGPPARPSVLSGLTAPGIVVGTPAYMAPEQWTGGKVGPASDQFAFCVALWEALAGERPFRGTTEEELRTEVSAGPAQLDTSKLPRRLRAVLVRGLAPKAHERWPSIDDLLAKLRGAERRPLVLGVAAAVVLAIAGGAVFVLSRGGASAPAAAPCEPPARDPSHAWSDGAALAPEVDAVFASELARWTAQREVACRASERRAHLACLDRALDQLALAHDAARAVTVPVVPDTVYELVVDPAACMSPAIPRIHVATGPDAAAAAALVLEASGSLDGSPRIDPARATPVAQRASDACTRAFALLAAGLATADVPAHRAIAADAASAAERCGDEHLIAEVALEAARFELEPPGSSAPADAARVHAETVVARLPQADVAARLALVDAHAAAKRGDFVRALARSDDALAAFATRGRVRGQIEAVLARAHIRSARAEPADLAAIHADFATWGPRAAALHDDLAGELLERYDAMAQWLDGDARAAHDRMVKAWDAHLRQPPPGTRRIVGDVVDEHGLPIAGAEVIAGSMILVDPYGVLPVHPDEVRAVVSGADGRFAIDAASTDRVLALHGDRRSAVMAPAERVHLALAPTRAASGRVAGAGPSTPYLMVGFVNAGRPQSYIVVAPVARDGTFRAVGLATGGLAVRANVGLTADREFISVQAMIPAGTADVKDLQVSHGSSGRTVYVIVRSELSVAFEQAMIGMIPGHVAVKKLGQGFGTSPRMVRIATAPSAAMVSGLPPEVARALRAGDTLARFDDVPDEPLSTCGFAVPAGITAGPAVLASPHVGELEVRCSDLAKDAKLVIVVTPPQKRFD